MSIRERWFGSTGDMYDTLDSFATPAINETSAILIGFERKSSMPASKKTILKQ